ncbi:MAG: hypothetical protein H6722_10065 [Sandaracinus sp.]|nr:hypothetical protein [Sandaracinus sp.]MCB9612782.1 hypothetical protein [Sandaracinus sp.]MCB9618235.1 hypothetical protein [Sandaracinus sp.]MCB9625199.1 hypothetical protein [Sandaracinus sp.]
MTPRDARILTLARSLAGPSPSFLDAIGALTTSVTRLVPAGRVFVLGATKDGPIVGSWISGVGIAPDQEGVTIVRVGADGRVHPLGPWLPTEPRTEALHR